MVFTGFCNLTYSERDDDEKSREEIIRKIQNPKSLNDAPYSIPTGLRGKAQTSRISQVTILSKLILIEENLLCWCFCFVESAEKTTTINRFFFCFVMLCYVNLLVIAWVLC